MLENASPNGVYFDRFSSGWKAWKFDGGGNSKGKSKERTYRIFETFLAHGLEVAISNSNVLC